jgi:hypothetical protein
MERIEQKYLRDLVVDNHEGDEYIRLSFVPITSMPNKIITIEKQSIPALIEALKKYQDK